MKKLFIAALVATLAACGGTNTVKVATHKEYVQPDWYQNCKDIDTESSGWKFWQSTTYYYSCGSSSSGFESAAHIKSLQIARRNLADRLNGEISSGSKIRMNDIGTESEMRSETETEMLIVNKITDTALLHYSETEHYSYKMGGNYHSFTMIKLSKENVDEMIDYARQRRAEKDTKMPKKQFNTDQLSQNS